MNLEQAARQALEVLEDIHRTGDTQAFDLCVAPTLIPALREALQEHALQTLSDFHREVEQEPVVELRLEASCIDTTLFVKYTSDLPSGTKLYLAPPVVQQGEPIAWIEVERGIPMFAKFAKGYKPEGDGLIPLYIVSPSVEAVRIETLEKVAELCDNCDPRATPRGIAAAIRGMK